MKTRYLCRGRFKARHRLRRRISYNDAWLDLSSVCYWGEMNLQKCVSLRGWIYVASDMR